MSPPHLFCALSLLTSLPSPRNRRRLHPPTGYVRCVQRLQDMVPRVNTLALGCGALAGHAFGIDREFLREKMGFDGITLNSMVRVM